MKKILISAWLLLSLFSQVASAEDSAPDSTSVEALLHQMSTATETLNYEMSYVRVHKNNMEPLLYRHAQNGEQTLAHLVYLSGPVREVIRRGQEISYIEPGRDPFSIKTGNMVAPLMPFTDSSIDDLIPLYDFVSLGQGREAGTNCQVIRIVPKDGLRYSYVLWIDERSKLPLRADLVNRNGEVLEQYRAMSYIVSDSVKAVLEQLNEFKLPNVLATPKSQSATKDWIVDWVPEGFEPHALNRYRMSITNTVVESQLYSDGLFNFSIYVSDKEANTAQKVGVAKVYKLGRQTLQTTVKGDKEISIIGDLPVDTAKQIINSVSFNSASPEAETTYQH